jgi:hypothetical protein
MVRGQETADSGNPRSLSRQRFGKLGKDLELNPGRGSNLVNVYKIIRELLLLESF